MSETINNNRWDRARAEQNIADQPIINDFSYCGRIDVDWDTIYNDLKSLDKWQEQDWYKWGWLCHVGEPAYPESEATKSVNLNQTQFFSTIGNDLDNYPPIKSILDKLGIEMPEEYKEKSKNFQACRIHRQMPGHMLWMHYDFSADDTWEQYFVYLNDWVPGQVTLMGTEAITNWRSGDVYKFNGHITPHGAVNCGYGERWLAVIKGSRRAPVDFGRYVDRP